MDQIELVRYLQIHGLLSADQAQIIPLAGGVSSDIMLVESGRERIVVKRSLPKLRVKDDWYCDTARNITEFEAIRYAGRLFPESVPRILHADAENRLFVMEYFGSDYSPWKAQLLQGNVDVKIGVRAANLLATLHEASWLEPSARQQFDTGAEFYALRVEPYLITTGRRHADLQHYFDAEAERIQRTFLALVHGDWSSKNILVSSERVIILDWEVAWFGDPAFDSAFFLNLIYLKSLYNRTQLRDYLQLMEVFRTTYNARMQALDAELERRIVRLTLMLMLGRIDGKSPAEYITSDRDKDLVRTFVRKSLLAGIETWDEVDESWQRALEAA